MLKYLVLFAISFCASLALTPLIRVLALGIGAVDRPNERKMHSKPIPRLGGVSVVSAGVIAVFVTVVLEQVSGFFTPLDTEAWLPVALGGAIVLAVGVWDDVRPLPVSVKFLFQGVAAGLAIWLGVRIEQVSFLGGGMLNLGWLAIPLTFLWIVGVTNAFNLVDGLDGLAAGLASIAAGTCAAIFLLRGDAQDAMLLVILLGALLGFLRYNFNPAKIFLGDSGSLVVGYVLGVTAITGSQKGATALAVVVPLLVFGLPILDTLLSMVRRFVGGLRMLQPYKAPLKQRILAVKRMFEADQRHIHHRLIAIGMSHRNAVLAMYAMALALSVMALISVFAQYRNAGMILVTVGLATYIGVRKLGYEEIRFLRSGTFLRWYEQLSFNRLFFLAFVDLALISAAYWLSFVLKYEFVWTTALKTWYLGAYPVTLVVQLCVFSALGLYRGVWRATGVGDLIRIVAAVSAAGAFSYIVVQLSVPPSGTLAFFSIDLMILGALVAGSRSLYRVLDYTNHHENSGQAEALIYGAGKGGQLVLRELLQNPELRLQPVGFLDDDASLRHRTVNRVPVLGTSSDLPLILTDRQVTTVVVSSNKIHGDRLREVFDTCRTRGITVLQAHLDFKPVEGNGDNLGTGNGGSEESSGLQPVRSGGEARQEV